MFATELFVIIAQYFDALTLTKFSCCCRATNDIAKRQIVTSTFIDKVIKEHDERWLRIILSSDIYRYRCSDSQFIYLVLSYLYITDALDSLCIILIKYGVDPSANCNLALREACVRGYTKAVQSLLGDPRVSPTFSNLDKACENNHPEVVKVLLDDGRIDPSDDNNFAIDDACGNGFLDVVKCLLNDPRVTPGIANLVWACENEHAEVVQVLLDDGRIDPSDAYDNDLPIMSTSSPEVFLMLLNDDRIDPSNHRVILSYSVTGPPIIVRLLLDDDRVDPTANDNQALRLATIENNPGTAELLLRDPRVANSVSSVDYQAAVNMIKIQDENNWPKNSFHSYRGTSFRCLVGFTN